MDGKMGICPDWYATGQAAKYWNVPPWEMVKQSIWWQDKALVAMTAEREAEEIKRKHQ